MNKKKETLTLNNQINRQVWSLLSDFHTGAKTGLTTNVVNEFQEGLLEKYKTTIKNFGPRPDVLLHLGDICDGVDKKGRDVSEISMVKQAEDAAKLILMNKPKYEVILVNGTSYHCQVGEGDDVEDIVAAVLRSHSKLKVTVISQLDTTINNWFTLIAKHHVGRSSLLHSRATAPKKLQMNAILEAQYNNEKRPDLIVSGHTHYFEYTENAYGSTMILPAWQCKGGKYGDRIMFDHIDVGACKLIIQPTREKGWTKKVKLYNAKVVPTRDAR